MLIWSPNYLFWYSVPTAQAQEEVRLTHFYYSEWPGGVEEGEQVLLIILIQAPIVPFLIDSFPGAWSNPWPSWPCGARPCSPGGGRPHRAHCCPLQVSSLMVVVAVDLPLLALPFFGFGLLMLSFIVDLHCCYNDLIIIVIKCFSCGIFASFNLPS